MAAIDNAGLNTQTLTYQPQYSYGDSNGDSGVSSSGTAGVYDPSAYETTSQPLAPTTAFPLMSGMGQGIMNGVALVLIIPLQYLGQFLGNLFGGRNSDANPAMTSEPPFVAGVEDPYGAVAEDPYAAGAQDPYGAVAEDPATLQNPNGASGEDEIIWIEPTLAVDGETIDGDTSAGPVSEDLATAPANVDPQGLAMHLNDMGATLYGAEWCPHCQEQKSLFGDSVDLVNFVDVDQDPDGAEAAGVEFIPTWVFPDGTIGEGLHSLEELAAVSGYETAEAAA